MASIAITFTHPQASFTRTATIPDAQLVRLIGAYKEIYGDSSLTNAQTLARMWQETLIGWRDAVRNSEQRTAAQAVTEIVIT